MYTISDILTDTNRGCLANNMIEGMDVMPVINGKKTSLKTGKPVGRPNAQFPDNWKEYYEKWRCGEVTAVKCMDRLDLKRSTFYKLVKIYEKDMDKREN